MRLLFISTHNVSRSIIAEAITKRLAGSRIKVMSGGTDPKEDIHPVGHRMLKQMRFVSTNLVSKSWDRFLNWQPDVVITLDDKVLQQKCPAYMAHAVHVHWPLTDPAAQFGNMEENFTTIIKIIEQRMKKVLDEDIENMNSDELRKLLKKVI